MARGSTGDVGETGLHLGVVELVVGSEHCDHGIGTNPVVIAGHRDGVGHAIGADPAINEHAAYRDYDGDFDQLLTVGAWDRGASPVVPITKTPRQCAALDRASGGGLVELTKREHLVVHSKAVRNAAHSAG